MTDRSRGNGPRLPARRPRHATADPDPATHAFLSATIFPRHAIVIDVDDLPELWA
jgi:hypothetical protein